MAQLLGLREEQVVCIRLFFPKERGVKQVDNRKAHPTASRLNRGPPPPLDR